MLLSSDARGVFPIAPTPFFDDGRIDTASIDRLVDFYRECGCTGLTVLGQLGEAPKLEHAESVDIAARAVPRADKTISSHARVVGVLELNGGTARRRWERPHQRTAAHRARRRAGP